MTDIKGKRILLGLTGGIAAYKAAELARLLVQAGVDVQVAMTEAASRFITPVTMQALSGKPVHSDLWDAGIPNNMAHIELTRDRDAILIAPASADFLAKLAHGRCDDLLSTMCVARDCPLLVAPAMNLQMWANPATQRNVQQLRADGIAVLGPASGDQACGETGMGRMLEAWEIFEELDAFFQPKLLTGKRVLITAGSTFEPIDTVRGITNVSSGKMGYAVARAAREAGAEVILVSGPTSLAAPLQVARTNVTTAQQMFDVVSSQAARADIFIAVAAVADYRVKDAKTHKIKRSEKVMHLDLVHNPDILGHVAGLKKPPFCVGFAAETENLTQYAQEKRKRKKIPLLAANLAQHAFGADDNELLLMDDKGEHLLKRAPKIDIARLLIAHIAKSLPNKTRTK